MIPFHHSPGLPVVKDGHGIKDFLRREQPTSAVSTPLGWIFKTRYKKAAATHSEAGFQARSKDQEILEEGGGAGPST